MTKLQKACCIIMSLCFWAVLAVMPDPFFMRGNAYRQFPLYCFLEKKARSVPEREDPETYEKLMEGNAAYLAKQMAEENRNLSTETVSENQDMLSQEQEKEEHIQPAENKKKTEIPAVTETPAITEAPSVTAAPVLAQIQPAPVINLAPEILADYDYLLNNFLL